MEENTRRFQDLLGEAPPPEDTVAIDAAAPPPPPAQPETGLNVVARRVVALKGRPFGRSSAQPGGKIDLRFNKVRSGFPWYGVPMELLGAVVRGEAAWRPILCAARCRGT